MAKFKCKNCGNIFEHFCDNFMDSKKAQCPKCKSHWVEIYDTQMDSITPYFGLGIQPVKIEPPMCSWCNGKGIASAFGTGCPVCRTIDVAGSVDKILDIYK